MSSTRGFNSGSIKQKSAILCPSHISPCSGFFLLNHRKKKNYEYNQLHAAEKQKVVAAVDSTEPGNLRRTPPM